MKRRDIESQLYQIKDVLKCYEIIDEACTKVCERFVGTSDEEFLLRDLYNCKNELDNCLSNEIKTLKSML